MKLVLVGHRFDKAEGSQKLYLFKTEQPLKAGDVVLCETNKGPQLGFVAADSEDFTEGGVKMMCLSQEIKELKPILGKFQLVENNG